MPTIPENTSNASAANAETFKIFGVEWYWIAGAVGVIALVLLIHWGIGKWNEYQEKQQEEADKAAREAKEEEEAKQKHAREKSQSALADAQARREQTQTAQKTEKRRRFITAREAVAADDES